MNLLKTTPFFATLQQPARFLSVPLPRVVIQHLSFLDGQIDRKINRERKIDRYINLESPHGNPPTLLLGI